MKRSSILLFFIALCIFSCSKNKTIDHSQALKFLFELKDCDPQTKPFLLKLPDFNRAEISYLIDYVNDMDFLGCVSFNSISSFYQSECTLGVYAMWMIEYIRLKEINTTLQSGFPSQNPILQEINSSQFEPTNSKFQSRAAAAYIKWWHENTSLPLQAKLAINPLDGTGLRWH